MKNITIFAATLMGLLSFHLTISAQERELWRTGHGDFKVFHQAGQFHWQVWEGQDPHSVTVSLGPAAKRLIPDMGAFSFLGQPGEPIWIAPMVEDGQNLFMGMTTEGTPAGTFENNRLYIGLNEFQGPGDFFMWTTGGAGSVEILMNARDGIDSDDGFHAPAPGHWHQNWGFNAPGTYLIQYEVKGTLAESGETLSSVGGPYRYAINVLDRGEVDLELAYEDGAWEWGLLEETSETLHDPADAALHLGPASWQVVPDDERFRFLGEPGKSVHVLPQDEQEGMLFLGMATDEIPEGIFEENQLQLNLTDLEGPGHLSLYAIDAFGHPTLFFHSTDGISEEDMLPMLAGAHAHQNWAFTEPGYYQVSLQASGTLANGATISSEEVTFYFEVFAPTVFSEGELDIEVAFEDDALELVFLDEANEREIFPSELVMMTTELARETIPEDIAYTFLGNAGDTVYVFPQEEQEGVLYVGIAGDEIESGLFEGEAVSLHLVSVRGPGNVSLYATDAFGSPQVFFNSGDGIDEQDVFPVTVGGHSHQNWAFTAPGVYQVDVQASGTLGGASEAIQSEVATFTFHIVGAPVTAVPLSLNRGSQGSLVLSWHATQGATYALETTQSLSAASWSLLGDRIQGEGARVERPLPADSLMKNQFFRLRRVR